jgi:hypothetical protein
LTLIKVHSESLTIVSDDTIKEASTGISCWSLLCF